MLYVGHFPAMQVYAKKRKKMCVFILGVMVDIFIMPPLTRPFGVLGVSRKPGDGNFSTYGQRTEQTFALCSLFSPYLSIAEPTLWN